MAATAGIGLLTVLGLIGAFVVVVVLFYFIGTGNSLARQQVKIQEADSGIDVALTKRYDTLTKMFAAAKGYMKHEQEMILQSIHLRSHMSIGEKAEAERKLAQAAHQIRVVAEAYPVLTSQALFVELQRAVADTEEHLQAARRLYNSNVSRLNQMVVSFPSSVVAGVRGIRQMPMFEADAAKRADVKLEF